MRRRLGARRLAACAALATAALSETVAGLVDDFGDADADILPERSQGERMQAEPVLEPGYPLLVPDIPSGERRCFALPVPGSGPVRVAAAVVGLAGAPALWGGWLPSAQDLPDSDRGAQAPPAAEVGFQSFDRVVNRTALEQKLSAHHRRISEQYYVCVSTLSEQGCDALLTAVVAEATADVLPPIRLRPNYPSIWTLGDGSSGAPARSLRFVIEADDLEDVRVSAVPVSGALDVAIYVQALTSRADDSCTGDAFKVFLDLRLPEVADVPHKQQPGSGSRRLICVRVSAAGQDGAVASLTVGPRLPGPFLAAAVPTGGRLGEAGQLGPPCELVRVLVNHGADTTLTAMAEDSSPLRLSASLSSESLSAPLPSRWKGETPAGGQGALLVIRGGEIPGLAAEFHSQGESTLSVAICRPSVSDDGAGVVAPVGAAGAAGGAVQFWITATTERDVVTLQDGEPFAAMLARTDADAAAGVREPWRDFRFFVPGGAAKPREVTISATSSCNARLFADTRRHPRRPGAYRWVTPEPAASHPVLRLTTEPKLSNAEVHLIDCRLPCFVYVSAHAVLENNASRDADLTIQFQSDAVTVKPLLEAQEQEETLAAGESQIFRYRAKHGGADALLFTLSVSSGAASFEVSSSAGFPEDAALTTRRADDAVLLEPGSSVLQAACGAARSTNASCDLFVRVTAEKLAASTFVVVASVAGAAKPLFNGQATRGAVAVRGYDRYRFRIDESEAKRQTHVAIDVFPIAGRAQVFVANEPNQYPRPGSFQWAGDSEQKASIKFNTSKPGWVYVGVVGGLAEDQQSGHLRAEPAAYTLRIRWMSGDSSETVAGGGWSAVALQDGMEELGHVAHDISDHFSFAAFDAGGALAVASLRLEALEGAVGLCVQGVRQPADSRSADDCDGAYAIANASDGVSGGLAAFDLDPEAMQAPSAADAPSELRLWVRGLSTASNGYALRALSAAPAATIVEEHTLVVDTMQPGCCVAPKAEHFQRRYLHFIPGAASVTSGHGALELELRALPDAVPAGVAVRARRKGGRARADGVVDEAESWPVEERLGEGGAARQHLHVFAELEKLLANEANEADTLANGFWLEVLVEAPRPLNFTLRFGGIRAASAAAATSPARLEFGARVVGVLNVSEAAGGQRFEFDLGSARAEEPRLRVERCTGAIRVSLPCGGDVGTALVDGADGLWDVALGAGLPRRAVDPSHFELLVEREDGEAARDMNTSFEVELGPTDTGLQLPNASKLTASVATGTITFAAALTSAGSAAAKLLRYTVVALPRNATPRFSAGTVCGLRAALSTGAALGSATLEVKSGGKAQGQNVSALMPSFAPTNHTVVVNVIAELVSSDGHSLVARSYTALELNATEAAALLRAARAAGASRGAVFAFLLALAVATVWVSLSRTGCCPKVLDVSRSDAADTFRGSSGIKRRPAPSDDVELEVQYDLHSEDRSLTGASARTIAVRPISPPRGGYVPPSV